MSRPPSRPPRHVCRRRGGAPAGNKEGCARCLTPRCGARGTDKSSVYIDPSAEAERLISTNHTDFGPPREQSYLADANRTWGNVRQTACTRPAPAPKFYPPERSVDAAVPAAASYTWSWPQRESRAAPPQIKRPAAVEHSFLEEYELRPPWLKY